MVTKTIASKYTGPPARTYRKLVEILPPRPIHDADEYEEAVAMVGNLVGFELNQDQEDYLVALDTFIEQYEAKHADPDAATKSDGLEMLRYLLEENSMNGADLSRLLGCSRNLGAMILRGTRNLTIEHARKLGDRFKVDPGLFIR